MLFSPHQTWAGRYGALRDTFQLEIRTFDVAAGYPLLTSVRGLPADCLYMITAPTDIGGVVIVTETGIIHVDQAGRIAASSVSGWWRHVTMLRADGRNEYMKLSLQGSKAVFVEREMVLVLADGSAHQVKLEMDGRAVGAIIVQERMAVLPPPAGISVLKHALFVGCAEGDSVLYDVDMVRDEVKGEEVKPYIDMDADDDGMFSSSHTRVQQLSWTPFKHADHQICTPTRIPSWQMDTVPPVPLAYSLKRAIPYQESVRLSTWNSVSPLRTKVYGRILSWSPSAVVRGSPPSMSLEYVSPF